jgi:Tfp pilus assembly protein PilE
VSLVEVLAVLAIVGVLISMSAPSFRRSLEHARADIAGANLRAIWTAQRIYWLEHRQYASDLVDLEEAGLLDPTVRAGNAYYAYAIVSADAASFLATATRIGSTKWSGQFSIGADGALAGSITAEGETTIRPAFQ